MSAADQILQGLTKVRASGKRSWTACCPSHADRSPSLAVKETDDGRVLLHCFGGCSVEAVLFALGLEMDALFPPRVNDPGGGHSPMRRPWLASDLLRLAAYESAIAYVVASDLSAGREVERADLTRFADAVMRLGDVACVVNS